jgi:hypothetical protein
VTLRSSQGTLSQAVRNLSWGSIWPNCQCHHMTTSENQGKTQNKWCRIAICYPNFRNCYTKPTSDLQFATQNYTHASQFATQISGIAIQSPHLICNLLHKITPKLRRNVKNCYAKLFFSITLWEKFRKSLHIERKVILSPAGKGSQTCQFFSKCGRQILRLIFFLLEVIL